MKRVGTFVLALVLVGLVSLEVRGSSITLPCASLSKFPTLWLNTSTQVTEVVGNRFTAYARKPNGMPYLDAWQRIELYEIQELELLEADGGPSEPRQCAGGSMRKPEDAFDILLRELDMDNTGTCTQTAGTRIIRPGISEQYVDLEITRPDWPDFKLLFTFSLVNETFNTTVPPSPETFNLEYQMNWSSQAPKMSFKITNWNWTSPGVVNSSLRLYFYSSALTEEDAGVTLVQHAGIPVTAFTTNTTHAFIQSTFLTAFRANGIDYVIEEALDDYLPLPISANVPQLAPFAVSLCHGYQPPNMTYSDLYYDPSIVALFTGPVDDPSSNPDSTDNNKKNKPLNPAAYIVPIVLVGLLIISLIALVIFIPSVRHFFTPFSKRQDRSSAGLATQSSQARPETGNGNNWARASTPASP